MKVRIRFSPSRRINGVRGSNRQMALMVAALLSPASLAAWLLGLWRIGAGLEWTGGFAIPSGIFSHWQVWFSVAVLLQLCSRMLTRYGRNGDRAAS